MRRSRAPSNWPGPFFAARSWAGCTTNMFGSDLRQAQVKNPVIRQQPSDRPGDHPKSRDMGEGRKSTSGNGTFRRIPETKALANAVTAN
jgi:hypothetical protein